jgi:hypothetical protein
VITLSSVTLSQRSRLLIAISSSIPSFRQLPVTTNRGKRSSIQVESKQKVYSSGVKPKVSSLRQGPRLAFATAAKVLYSSDLRHSVGRQLDQKQQKVLCSSGVKPKVSSLRQGPRLAFATAAKGPLFKWRQTKGFVSSSRSEARFRNSSKRSSIQVAFNQRLRL